MIADTINQKIAEALKAHDEIRLSTLRLLSSALNYEFIAKQHKLSEEEELVVVVKEAKKRKEAIEIYKKVGANDRAEKEGQELRILEGFLPKQIGEEELVNLVDQMIDEVGARGLPDMGKVIGAVKAKVGAKAEGSRIAEMVRSKLI